jgi:hypothetical protein
MLPRLFSVPQERKGAPDKKVIFVRAKLSTAHLAQLPSKQSPKSAFDARMAARDVAAGLCRQH